MGRALRARELGGRPTLKANKLGNGWDGKTCTISEIYNKLGYVPLFVQGKALMHVEDSLLPEFAQFPWTPFY